MLSRIGPNLFFDLLSLMRADAMGQNPAMLNERLSHYEKIEALAREIIARGDALTVSDLAITGHDLMAEGLQGKDIGKALAKALEWVLENPDENGKENLLKKLI